MTTQPDRCKQQEDKRKWEERIGRLQALARAQPRTRFTALMGIVSDERGLRAHFEAQPGNKAAGIDGQRKADYAERVDERLQALGHKLKRSGWRPQAARRVFIPKANGGRRPLGIPSFEDRIVQAQLASVLQAIWEPQFRECSYGFRAGRNAHQALERLRQVLTQGATQWVVEADIQGFFDNVRHEQLLSLVRQRVADPGVLRLIARLLKAGVQHDGQWRASEAGTPQGGLVSPVLANIYLHYVLDEWFERHIATQCAGRATLVRYADDFVVCFTHQADAQRFIEALHERLAEYGLKVEPSKTALLAFGSRAAAQAKGQGTRAASFNFLGFTHYVSRTRSGCFAVGRKTQRERFARKLRLYADRLKALRGVGTSAMLQFARQHLKGHEAYYAIGGNLRAVRTYVYWAVRHLYKWINRRSQRRSLNWARFGQIVAQWIPSVRLHPRAAAS